ncbi:hypothetical protein EC957_007225 [Mortierella hygrophila]|uniref:RING-type domain-containing protein n=1 Tax=Mortierella hygrophila TaxID=979708 RepID=A0A9P6JY70_9FUNG|nr:hypothetical protein EC957_007225 [Mortierella hygrophila]
MSDNKTQNLNNTTKGDEDDRDDREDTSNTDPICAICLASYTGRVYLSPCMHSFCASCLSAWVDVSVLCPLCKSKPDQIHWGVDTALGVLNTITVTSSSPFYASGPDRWRGRREATTTGGLTWREALRDVAVQARKDEEEQGQLDLASTEADLQEGDAALDDTSVSTTGGASESEGEDGCESVQEQHDQRFVGTSGGSKKRSRSHSRSRSRSRSRSKSTTPIDSYPYDSDALFSSSHSSLFSRGRLAQGHGSTDEATSTTVEGDDGGTAAAGRTASRQEVYALGLEPTPEQDFAFADEIRPIDVTFLTPFLQQDLAVLTNSGDRPVDPIILDLIISLFVAHGSKASFALFSRGGGGQTHKRQALEDKDKQPPEWNFVEMEVAQWIALRPSKESWSEVDMARLFVREMRRVVKKRWTVKRWNSTVLYQPMPPLPPLTLPSSAS